MFESLVKEFENIQIFSNSLKKIKKKIEIPLDLSTVNSYKNPLKSSVFLEYVDSSDEIKKSYGDYTLYIGPQVNEYSLGDGEFYFNREDALDIVKFLTYLDNLELSRRTERLQEIAYKIDRSHYKKTNQLFKKDGELLSHRDFSRTLECLMMFRSTMDDITNTEIFIMRVQDILNRHLLNDSIHMGIVSEGNLSNIDKKDLLFLREDYFLYLNKDENQEERGYLSYFFCEIAQDFERLFFFFDDTQNIESLLQMWKKAFQGLEHGVAIFANSGELIIHNSFFSNLSLLPKECFEFSDGQAVEIQGKVFRVQRSEYDLFGKEIKYFVISEMKMKGGDVPAVSSEELGIISSSIAHELNNPITGIMAGLSLMELEEIDGEDLKESIEQMRESAKRCRDLILIFLGFSRISPNDHEKDNVTANAFKQAIDLLRFRMMESHIRLNVQYDIKANSHLSVNESIMAMIFYLILNEVLTEVSHHVLIAPGQSEVLILGSYQQTEDYCIFEIETSLDFEIRFSPSKLLSHLIELVELNIVFSNNKFVIGRQQDQRLI